MEQRRKVDIHGLLSRMPLFAQIEAADLARISEVTHEQRLEKGQRLFNQGDPATGFYIVVYGQVKLAIAASSGHEKVVEILGPLQSFGEAVMFMGKPYPVFAESLADCLLLHIPGEPLFQIIERNGGFARRMLAGLSMRLHALVQDVEAYSMRSSTQRLIGYLLSQVGENTDSNTAEVELVTSKQVLASRLNLTPETFSRILHALSDAGLIEVRGKQITLRDLERLARHEA
jgi:CRP/FNR family transcriptional regulator, dissimilatory nitrate respiration regulator